MMEFKTPIKIFASVLCGFVFCSLSAQKIKGVSLVSHKLEKPPYSCSDIMKLGANWIAITPFAIMQSGSTDVAYNSVINWYGDRKEGLTNQIRTAKKQGLKVCVKPHLYVKGEGWPGAYNPGKSHWKTWEANYSKYIFFLAEIAERESVDLFLVGTECKTSVKERPQFWFDLIKNVREKYSGSVSYASNWDNYDNVPFWNQLDLISIDAYFPLSNKKTPGAEEIERAWGKLIPQLRNFSNQNDKPIIFTEYGYRSTDNCAFQQWVIESRPKNEKVNLLAQENAYQGFYNSIWSQDWFAGGFIWKWYPNNTSGGKTNSDYTPQGKPVLDIIHENYSK